MILLKKGEKDLYQWDTGIKLFVGFGSNEVHFSNTLYGDAITVTVKNGEVEIPNEFLTKTETFYCWAYISKKDGGETFEQKRFEIRPRPKPAGYVYTPSEAATVKELVDEAVKAALNEAKESGEFQGEQGEQGEAGYTPQRGVDYWTEEDKTEIVNDVLAALPNANGVSF